jgi:hypothetical protein
MDAYTPDYVAYNENPVSAPFMTPGDTAVTPVFNAYESDTDLVLLSPVLSLEPGQSTTFTFYYTFGTVPIASGSPVPATGAVEGPETFAFLTSQRANNRFRGWSESLKLIAPERAMPTDCEAIDGIYRGLQQGATAASVAYAVDVQAAMQLAQQLRARICWMLLTLDQG